MKKSLIAFTTFIALLATFFSGPMSPANADPLATDASITSLTFGSPNYFDYYGRRDTSGLYPSFDQNAFNYQLATVADILDVNAVLSDPLATMNMTIEGVTAAAQSEVPYRISLQPKVSVLNIEVIAQDGVTSKNYRVTISNQILQTPEIVSMSSNTSSWTGGKQVTIRMKNVIFTNYWLPGGTSVYCQPELRVTALDPKTGRQESSGYGFSFGSEPSPAPDEYGITTMAVTLPSAPVQGYTGEATVSLINNCSSMMRFQNDWAYLTSESSSDIKLTYLPLAITDIIFPSTVTGGSIIEVRDPNIYPRSNLQMNIEDPATGSETWIENASVSAEPKKDTSGYWRGVVSSYSREAAFRTAGKKTLRIGYQFYNPVTSEYEFEVLQSRTINWKPVLPSSVTISPAKSDLAGGKRVRVEGYDLCNQGMWPNVVDVKIDGKPLTNIEMQYGNSYCGDPYGAFSKPQKQWFTALVPAGTSTGVKNVTVDNGNGPVKVSATFAYGSTPAITSIDQTSVASTGGSKIRISGSNFGFSGTPTVVIGGKKSPKVTLLSDGQMDVIVPLNLAVGNASISVISSSGGGANLVPATINVVAPTQNPSVSALSVTEGLSSGGESVSISVSNIGTPSNVGVMFGSNPADVISASASQIIVKVPSGSVGSSSVTVSGILGQTTLPNAYTYKAIPGVRSVSPSSVASTADEAGRTITITGVGFGDSGTIKVGQQAAKPYLSEESGTKISGVIVPNETSGSLAILITPAGSLVPIATSVTVTRPNITYAGTEEELSLYNATCAPSDYSCLGSYGGYTRPVFSSLGGDVLKIKGTNFGTSGTLKIGSQTVTPESYSDTVILVELPPLTVGEYDLTVVPTSGLQTDIWKAAFSLVDTAANHELVVSGVVPTVPNTRGDELYTFDPSLDPSSVFEITGYGFLGDDNGASTRVRQLDQWDDPRYQGGGNIIATILTITDTKITFSAARTFVPIRWTGISVETKDNLAFVRHAIRYVGNPPPTAYISGYYGLCTNTAINIHNPATVTVTGTGMFGESGSVNLSGQAIDAAAVTWTTDGVTVDFSKMPENLPEHWGQKALEFVPADGAYISRTFSWFCGVMAEVETKVNGSSSELTITAGDDLTPSAGIPVEKRLNEEVPAVLWPRTGYQYQSAADHARGDAWTYNVKSGLPTYAGDWYIRADPNTSTPLVDRGLYVSVVTSDVHVVIDGTAIAFTPKLKGSTESSIIYKGQLGDGTNNSSEDIEYTVDIAGAPEITEVVWEYRNHACALLDGSYSWSEGLPTNVAIIPEGCGGNGTSASSWDIRVKSFEMMKDGKDQAMFYLPTFNTFNLTIDKRALTIDQVTATKPFDGNANIYLGALTVTGAIEGETPTLSGNEGRNGYFADALVSNNKPVYVSGTDGESDFIQRIKLEGSYDWNYYLTNSELLVLGSITKANARLALSASNQALIMSVLEQSIISASVIDTRTNEAPNGDSALSELVVTVSTPSICSISADLVVSAIAPGECVVQASQAASVNYNASVATNDPESNTETFTINVFAEPRKVSVITQDLVISQGDTPSPSYETLGLLDGDAVDSVVFEYFDGAVKLDSAPTEPGRYTMVGSSANISTSNPAAYDASIEFVAGLLVITTPPPTVSGMTPQNGIQAGGEKVVISGENLGAVTSIRFGNTVIPNTGFVVNGEATEISFLAPAGSGNVSVVLVAGDSEIALEYSYDPIVADITDVAPTSGSAAGGNLVVVTGTNLELVTEVRFGTVLIASASITRSPDGKTLSFRAPAGTGKVNMVLETETGTASFEYTYTAAPPVLPEITGAQPSSGPMVGGNLVVVTGTNLDLVSGIIWGELVIASENLTLSEDGTSISFNAPAGSGKVAVTVQTTGDDYTFGYTYKVAGEPSLLLQIMNPEFGKKFSGLMIKMSGTNLKPGGGFTLDMYSKRVAMTAGTVGSDGSIKASMRIPGKGCVTPGLHKLIFESEDESGKKISSTFYIVLGANCELNAVVEKISDGSWSVKGLRFDYQKWTLSGDSKATLKALKPWLKNAIRVKVSGYTETDGKGNSLKIYNKVLAKKRVLSTINQLKSLGFKTYFMVNPVGAKNPTSKDQSKNRRVELNVRF